ncbi:DUF4255 domain-containing protein [Flavobacterium procerum]|uniref:DUF4255 domain-containing protein n=1 Tax=Flavobacterium procerum TaxID=1455569 RepID=A0ABV6BVU1_9FLAO
MIYEALTCLAEELNDFFKLKLSITEEKVILSGLINADGVVAIPEENKIVATLVNLEKETSQILPSKAVTNSFGNQNTPLQINIYVLFSAYFSSNNYGESLRFISFVMAYFQGKNVFTKSNTPNMDPKMEKLSIEIVDLSMDALSNLWSLLGAKYMPSVLYKIRMLHFDESVVREFRPGVSKIDNQSKAN